MKYLKQLFVVLILTFVGEILNLLIPFPIPAGVYGLVILLALLQLKWIKVDSISETGSFLLEIMPVMFIPSSVGLIMILGDIKNNLIFLLIMIIISTVFVMGVTGVVSQHLVRYSRKKRESQEGRGIL